ncbi:MAG: hypothetical protein V3V78_03860 [Candidatus Woesearchaeota archaeon]
MDDLSFLLTLVDVVKPRVEERTLHSFGKTQLPYYIISGTIYENTIVRKGILTAEKPMLYLPEMGNDYYFEGFDVDEETLSNARRSFSIGYRFANKIESQTNCNYSISDQVVHGISRELEENQDTATAVMSVPEEYWHAALFKYLSDVCTRSVPGNIIDFRERGLL